MPTRSTGNVPAGIRDLGLPGRAVTALTRAGVTTADELSALTRRQLAAVPGLGPGMIAAIRLVVPEPDAGDPGVPAATGPDDRPDHRPDERPDEGGPAAASGIPSFASMRASGRRTAVDLLVPGALPATGPAPAEAPASAEPPEEPAQESVPEPVPPLPSAGPAAPPPGRAGTARPGGAPRPAEYADLWYLGIRVARAVAGVPLRLARWSVREPLGPLCRVLGGHRSGGDPLRDRH